MILEHDLKGYYARPGGNDRIELRAFTHGLMPLTVPEKLGQFANDWMERGVDAWNAIPNHWHPGSDEPIGWWNLPSYLGDHFIAPLLNAAPGTCIMQPNAHWTVNCLLSSRTITPERNQIIVSADAFPSVLHSAKRWTQLRNIDVIEIPVLDSGYPDLDTLIRRINDKTAYVFLSHVGFKNGFLIPDNTLIRCAEVTRMFGALLAVDGYHATCSMQVDVATTNIDVYFGGLLKEGSGSSGNGFVYISPDADIDPMITGWLGDADPFGFRQVPTRNPEVRLRFLGGTTPIAPLYHSVEGVRLLLEYGLDKVRHDCLKKTAFCIDLADRIGLDLVSPREDKNRSALLVFAIDNADLLCEQLKQQGVYVDSRKGNLLRMAPFVWNRFEELEKTFDLLQYQLSTGSYRNATVIRRSGPVT